uniref:three-finger toxin MALT0070C-like n=1 Tax=Myxine glutinosa TaxID=7769 RepID=UPI00358E14CB
MSVLPFVVLIGFLGAAAGLKCYVGTSHEKMEMPCPGDGAACSSITVTDSKLTGYACNTKSICASSITGSIIKCCYTDLCNSAMTIPSSNILMILTMSLSMMLTYIM